MEVSALSEVIHSPFFSIIVTSYNNESLIGEALSSAISQTYTNFEIIVTDNCSTDNSWDVISSFADSRVRSFRQRKNLGMYSNLNFGVSKARGTYLKFLCSDDLLHPQCLEIIWILINNLGGHCAENPFHVNHEVIQDSAADPLWQNSSFLENIKFKEVNFATGSMTDVCLSRERFIQSGVFGHPDVRKDFSRDILAFGLSAIGVKKIHVQHQLAFGRIHANQSRHLMIPTKRFQLEEVLFVYSMSGRLEDKEGKISLNRLFVRHLLSSLKYLFCQRDPSYVFYVLIFGLRNPWILLAISSR